MRGDLAAAFGLAGFASRTDGTYTPGPSLDDELDADDPLDWHDQAACRPDLRPPELTRAEWTALFYPERGQSLAAARQICLACPVRDDCLAYALDGPEKFGVWGGSSERDRRRLRRNRKAA